MIKVGDNVDYAVVSERHGKRRTTIRLTLASGTVIELKTVHMALVKNSVTGRRSWMPASELEIKP